MLKRLCDKGIFQNNSGNVVSVLSKQEWFTKQSEGLRGRNIQRFSSAILSGVCPPQKALKAGNR